jgi:hypothetical protein
MGLPFWQLSSGLTPVHGRLRCGISTRGQGKTSVKMVAEYLEKALDLELLAAAETDPTLKADLTKQAEAYRKLAAKRALHDKLTPLDN